MHHFILFLTFPRRLELEPVGPLSLLELVGGHDLDDVDGVGPQVGDRHLVVELVLLRVHSLFDHRCRRQAVLLVGGEVELVPLVLPVVVVVVAAAVLLTDKVVVRKRLFL